MAGTSPERTGGETPPPAAAVKPQAEVAAQRGALGVKVQSIDEDMAAALGLAAAKGALVTEIMADGPAALAGVRANDAILALNGESIADGKELARQIAKQAPGTAVDLKIHRGDGEQTIKVTLGSVAGSPKEASSGEPAAPAGQGGSPRLGLGLMQGGGGEGVVISDVASNSDAAKKGLMTGDTILEVDGKAVSSPSEVVESVEALKNKGRKAVLLLVKSGEQTRAVPVRFSVVG
jgi:serine protease Do